MLQIDRNSSPVIIDGELSEWGNASAVTFKDDSGRGRADNIAKVKALWDDKYLYFAFEVTDTNLQAVETNRDGNIYLDDAVEVYIDTFNDNGSVMKVDDYQFLVNIINVKSDMKGTGNGKDASWNSNMISAVKIDGTIGNNGDIDKGYTMEIAIPWSDIGGLQNAGNVIGLDLAVGDRDLTSDGYHYFDLSQLTSFAVPDKWRDAVIK